MYYDFTFSDVSEALPVLLDRLLREGQDIGSRAGRTQELTHVGICLTDPINREILLPIRKANIAAQIAETMWVLAGRDDIAWLEHYLPRVRDFSDNGETWRAGYGKRLRAWEDHGNAKTIDQWRWLVSHLLKDRASRRAVMSIWDPAIDTEDGKDIPCNDWLSFLNRNGSLDLHVALRSNDVIWGWSGINQFEWSSLLEITAGLLGVRVGSLHFSTTSFHLYDHHFDKAHKIIDAVKGNPPKIDYLEMSPRFDEDGHIQALAPEDRFAEFEALMDLWFRIEYDIRTGSPLVQHYVDHFPEPMLRSWLRVLQWYWSAGVRQDEYLKPLEGTRLYEATRYSIQPPRKETQKTASIAAGYSAGQAKVDGIMEFDQVSDLRSLTVGKIFAGNHTVIRPEGIVSPFLDSVFDLHLAKHAAYGDSWKKRGEKFSILPNIGRKVDRLGQGETDDETSADTAIDLMVYLAKYTTWLNDFHSIDGPDDSDDPSHAHVVLANLEPEVGIGPLPLGQRWTENFLKSEYETLLEAVEADHRDVVDRVVKNMLPQAYRLARTLWEAEQDEYKGADVD